MSEDYGFQNTANAPLEMEDASPTTTSTGGGTGCCGCSCCDNVKQQGWFGVEEYGKTLDIPETFGRTDVISRLFKVFTWGMAVSTTAYSWYLSRDYPGFYMAYLTYWTGLLTLVYVSLSLWLSMVPPSQPLTNKTSVSVLVKATWLWFSLVANLNLTVVILFWALDFDYAEDTLEYQDVMSHGGVALLVWIEGFVINKIPIRLPHLSVVYLVAILYILWSVIHGVGTDIGNPFNQNANGTYDESGDNLIYGFIDWKDDPLSGFILMVLVLGILMPLVFGILWMASLLSFIPPGLSGKNRRYVSTGDDADKDGGASPHDNVNVYAEPY